ncbi:uncharacterized protein LOC114292030 [Camellia sinensis]|uniref:uncharacterized protein LOC114292030 n=1 Tax=Camellia sinensis TaxID=4442 RepID=UPI0010366541|nr:uncharacterized protein LOC114292030 [Camellia sinensis]
MPGHSCCSLQSEEDLEVMVELALSCDIHRIDIFVKCCSLGEGYMICDGEASSSVCETDFLPSFYSNQRKPLLSDGWVNCMKEVGQRFAQGVVEFRDALSKMTSSMIGGLISSDICNKALTSVNEVVCDFKDYYGTEVSYRRAWMGIEKARSLVFGDYSSSFDDLRWYVNAANACNPGSVFDMEFDIDSKGRHFKCLFFAFEACLYPLCFAIVDNESYDSWHWFLSKLLGILTPERDIAFVSDRHGGLLKALAEVFPFSCNSFCLMHLKRNLKTYLSVKSRESKEFSSHSFCLIHLKTNLKIYLSVKSRESKEYLLTLFSICAYAPTIELFNELFEEFKSRCGRTVEKFLEDLPNEC